jgi:hypothetical protein
MFFLNQFNNTCILQERDALTGQIVATPEQAAMIRALPQLEPKKKSRSSGSTMVRGRGTRGRGVTERTGSTPLTSIVESSSSASSEDEVFSVTLIL